ncbi:DUF2845 domain-containing protein [Methylomicrobium lacus]|uniref:DUF2845 domain-containing protein n=1 Tax=Methylomicrobium lacus TaxID=136992 RepID=UPI00045E7688|nr:DUF2845 domain-containing protein [Methylomicrobium lacus]
MGFRNLVLLVLLMQAGPALSTSTMRCGHNIVELGDDTYKVLETCGEPASIYHRTKIVGSTLHHPRRTLDIEEYEEIQVEEWVYDFGRNRIRQSLLFENGRMVEINDLKRSR